MNKNELIERLKACETSPEETGDSKPTARVSEELQERERRLAAILETAVEGIITINERGTIESFNRAAVDMFSYSEPEVLGQNVKMLMPQPYKDEHDGYLKNYHNTGKAQIIGIGREVTGRRKSGDLFPMEMSISEVKLHDRKVFTGFVRDITDRRELERQILETRHNEQRHIGRELHDNLGQQLTGIEFMSQALEQKLSATDNENAKDAAEIARLVRQAISHTRGLSHGLNPVMVESGGLIAALQDLAATTEELFQTKCEFNASGPVHINDNSVAFHLYRIAQESVNNAIKHGKPKRIQISLTADSLSTLLSINDNGSGLVKKTDQRPGIGLRIMQYRAGIIGAALAINKNKDGGAEVTCSVPCVSPT
ncbi:PAS domain S-box protein [Verrucomicrobia bacterium]|nr:PAS domain S-box protein [Verrucomicrobiota bacterium]